MFWPKSHWDKSVEILGISICFWPNGAKSRLIDTDLFELSTLCSSSKEISPLLQILCSIFFYYTCVINESWSSEIPKRVWGILIQAFPGFHSWSEKAQWYVGTQFWCLKHPTVHSYKKIDQNCGIFMVFDQIFIQFFDCILNKKWSKIAHCGFDISWSTRCVVACSPYKLV